MPRDELISISYKKIRKETFPFRYVDGAVFLQVLYVIVFGPLRSYRLYKRGHHLTDIIGTFTRGQRERDKWPSVPSVTRTFSPFVCYLTGRDSSRRASVKTDTRDNGPDGRHCWNAWLIFGNSPAASPLRHTIVSLRVFFCNDPWMDSGDYSSPPTSHASTFLSFLKKRKKMKRERIGQTRKCAATTVSILVELFISVLCYVIAA